MYIIQATAAKEEFTNCLKACNTMNHPAIAIPPSCQTTGCPNRSSSNEVQLCHSCARKQCDAKQTGQPLCKCVRCGNPPPQSHKFGKAAGKLLYICFLCGKKLFNMWPMLFSQAKVNADIEKKNPSRTFSWFSRKWENSFKNKENAPTECRGCNKTSNAAEALGGKCASCTMLWCLEERKTHQGIIVHECHCGLLYPSRSSRPHLCASCYTRIRDHMKQLIEQNIMPRDFAKGHDVQPLIIEHDIYDDSDNEVVVGNDGSAVVTD